MSLPSDTDSTYLSAQPQSQSQSHSQVNRYIPQSPQPASPPQTPSPTSPNHNHNHISKQAIHASHNSNNNINKNNASSSSAPAAKTEIMADRLSPTPEGYTYTSPDSTSTSTSTSARPPNSRSSSSNSSLAGMGINFPPEHNPLPAELISPTRETSPLPSPEVRNAPASTANASVLLQKSRSSDGSTNQSSSMLYTASAGAGANVTTGSSSSNLPSTSQLGPPPTYGTLHPSTSAQFTARPRTVSPRAHGGTDAFASSSSVLSNPSEARGRVVSPNKLDGMGISSPIDYVPGISSVVDSLSNTASSNPYDPPIPNGNGNGKASFQFNNYGQHQPYYPLTGGRDKEAQYGSTPTVQPANVPFKDSVGYWLGLYFCFNLGLTLFNKFVLVSFPFPYTLTGLHALSGCAGCYFALEQGAFVPARLTQKENLILAAFSVLYTINIAVSNISLQLVTVPFHQVVRASTPLFTILISTIFLRTKFSLMKLVSLLPVVAGVGFATYGDYYFTAWGLILTLLGTFLAALKTVVTNLIQTGGGNRLKLHPLDLLMRMSPLAFIQCVVYGWYTGELERVRRYGATQMTRGKAIALLINGVIACGLNIVSFTANKKAGALTMTVSANCKQVLTIALAVVLFNLHISPTNGLGILLTLIGGGWYGYVEYMEKKKKTVKLVDRA